MLSETLLDVVSLDDLVCEGFTHPGHLKGRGEKFLKGAFCGYLWNILYSGGDLCATSFDWNQLAGLVSIVDFRNIYKRERERKKWKREKENKLEGGRKEGDRKDRKEVDL